MLAACCSCCLLSIRAYYLAGLNTYVCTSIFMCKLMAHWAVWVKAESKTKEEIKKNNNKYKITIKKYKFLEFQIQSAFS